MNKFEHYRGGEGVPCDLRLTNGIMGNGHIGTPFPHVQTDFDNASWPHKRYQTTF